LIELIFSFFVTYIDVADIKSSLKEIIALGATLQQDATDVAKGLLVESVKDKEGNILGLDKILDKLVTAT
jgi:predicted enzyme related to lactoylglutathione lyase